jgi:hypothetical protein
MRAAAEKRRDAASKLEWRYFQQVKLHNVTLVAESGNL